MQGIWGHAGDLGTFWGSGDMLGIWGYSGDLGTCWGTGDMLEIWGHARDLGTRWGSGDMRPSAREMREIVGQTWVVSALCFYYFFGI